MPTALNRSQRAALRKRVLATATELIAAGTIPSEKELRDRLPGRGVHALINLRNELRDAGLLDWEHLRERPRFRASIAKKGLTGKTHGERQQIQAARLEILREKIARGEPPCARPGPETPPRVYHYHKPQMEACYR